MSKFYSEKKKVTIAIKDKFIEDMKSLNDGSKDCIDSADYVFDLSLRYEYSDRGVREILERFCVRANLKAKNYGRETRYYLED